MKEIEFLKEIVKEANELTKKHFEVYAKEKESDLVTSLDLEIEKFLTNKINKAYPDYTIVSEEYNTNNPLTENCFVIDPIDGTINFANNLPLWGIQIACIKNGETIASVISLPRINEFYYADETGAYLNEEKIHVREVPIKNALYSVDGGNTVATLANMQKHTYSKRILGAVCASMAFVAAGRIHGAIFQCDSPWDYTPGLFLCKMAGAKIKNVDGFHCAAMNQEFLDILEKETVR